MNEKEMEKEAIELLISLDRNETKVPLDDLKISKQLIIDFALRFYQRGREEENVEWEAYIRHLMDIHQIPRKEAVDISRAEASAVRVLWETPAEEKSEGKDE